MIGECSTMPRQSDPIQRQEHWRMPLRQSKRAHACRTRTARRVVAPTHIFRQVVAATIRLPSEAKPTLGDLDRSLLQPTFARPATGRLRSRFAQAFQATDRMPKKTFDSPLGLVTIRCDKSGMAPRWRETMIRGEWANGNRRQPR